MTLTASPIRSWRAKYTREFDTDHVDMVSCLTMTATTYFSRRTILPMHGIGVRTHVRR